MKKSSFKLAYWAGLFTLIFILFSGCKKEDPVNIVAEDFVITMNENPIQDYVIGTINATSSHGAMVYDIEAQNPEGALAIDHNSGELTVANPALFDYEAYPAINAAVLISCAETDAFCHALVTISLRNMPDVWKGDIIIIQPPDFGNDRTD